MPHAECRAQDGSSQSPLSLHNTSIWALSTLPSFSQLGGLHCGPVSTLTPHRPLASSPPPPPNVHQGVWGWPICDRSEVSLGLGKGASQSGTGGAGHTVGFLSNWKPGAQQNPVHRLSGTEPAMTARPRQAGTFRCIDSLSHRSRVRPSNSRPQWNRWPWSRFWANFKELHNFTVSDL